MTHTESILVIEDDLFMQDVVKLILEQEGYNVVSACSGNEALEILRSNCKLSLILLDQGLPDMTGFMFLDHKNSEQLCPSTPVVFFSAAANLNQSALPTGVVASVSKPFQIDTLLSTIQKSKKAEPDFSPNF
ncbi:MAG: response regulator [Pseudobdellovibrio sp.]